MTHTFDKDYWESHWEEAGDRDHDRGLLANPYLAREVGDLVPGSALDAGCGEGVEAIWLAVTGWDVTAVDISAAALERARRRAGDGERAGGIDWVEADLGVWIPDRRFDLVMTHYAHPAMPQLDFYRRIADWVTPGGTLLVVGHLHGHDHGGGEHGDHGDDHKGDRQGGDHGDHHDHVGPARPPREVSVTAGSITGLFDSGVWDVVTADEATRLLRDGGGRTIELHDVVFRAVRCA